MLKPHSDTIRMRFARFFECSAGLLLVATAIAKFISSTGSSKILGTSDPVFQISYRKVLVVVGLIEIVVARFCFFDKGRRIGVNAVALLATNFLIYRLGLLWMGVLKPCPCLGNLTDALHIPPKIADDAMKVALAYLLIGSYGLLLWFWSQHWRPLKPQEPPVSAADSVLQ